jgi:hypothetical protein
MIGESRTITQPYGTHWPELLAQSFDKLKKILISNAHNKQVYRIKGYEDMFSKHVLHVRRLQNGGHARTFFSHVRQLLYHVGASKTELENNLKIVPWPTDFIKSKMKFRLITRSNIELRIARWTHPKCRAIRWSLHLTSRMHVQQKSTNSEDPFSLGTFSFVDTSWRSRSPYARQRRGLWGKLQIWVQENTYMFNGISHPFIL